MIWNASMIFKNLNEILSRINLIYNSNAVGCNIIYFLCMLDTRALSPTKMFSKYLDFDLALGKCFHIRMRRAVQH